MNLLKNDLSSKLNKKNICNTLHFCLQFIFLLAILFDLRIYTLRFCFYEVQLHVLKDFEIARKFCEFGICEHIIKVVQKWWLLRWLPEITANCLLSWIFKSVCTFQLAPFKRYFLVNIFSVFIIILGLEIKKQRKIQ